jgi:hypothetical protein
MVNLSNLSEYMKAGILLILLGLMILGIEECLWEESIQVALYLLPIGCFISGVSAFTIDGVKTSYQNH